MIVEFEDTDGDDRVVYFGVNDVITTDGGQCHVFMHSTIDFEDDQNRDFFEDRPINFVTEESSKQVIDTVMFLADNIFSDSTEVVIGLTYKFDSTIRAVQSCIEEEDVDTDSVTFVGDTSLIE